ncbi:hypothetical protein M2284_003926 [Rhodococcus sp. LBL1]|uniref:Ferredoxin n=1 Tax=Prescottella agglutinans TaxID=1644129 RepID=A0ABT6MGW0_9NOCA|nr:hypothetical protein [Prescottella agglutinans]MDH6283560.1 hypothetical protein [Prescottella agglutinans]MDH6679702.1 hypothetical protein [Rhodococcus sp. LBL1]MDH6682078.1 hypothetical protein [Rhodococcus sp. LBL2]
MTSTWAKAPNYADSPARVEAVRAQTAADLHSYLEEGLHEVECRTCGTCVLVRKNSYRHTSIQWQDDPAKVCPEFTGSGGRTGSRQTCPRLLNSINHAVMEGILEVRDPQS